MPLDFPTAPINGQVYDQWQWDGAKWVAIVGTLPAGPAGPTGPPGVSAGRIFYYDATDASDIAGYAKLLASPSANPEKTLAVACTGVGVDFAVEEFATDPGVPGAVDYPAGTAYRRIYAHVNSGTARLHLRIYIRTAAGVETLVRDEVSPDFTDQTVALQEWVASAPAGGAMLATDRIVNKLSAQRVTGGGGTVTVTCHFEGTTTGSHIQTTIATGGSIAGMNAGQIPIAASAAAIASSANLSGDITSAPTTLATTLATVNANVGTFQGLTLDGKGRVTAASNQNYVTGGPYLPLTGGTLSNNLSVSGIVTAQGAAGGFTFVDRGDGAKYWQWYSTANQAKLSSSTGGDRFLIDSTGNLATTGTQLSFGGSAQPTLAWATNSYTYLNAPGAAPGGAGLLLGSSGVSNLSYYRNEQHFFANAAGSTNFAVFQTAGTYNVSGSWLQLSDEALKENIEPYTRGLDAILQLEPVSYTYQPGTPFAVPEGEAEPTRFGLMAQQVEPHIPEVVGEATMQVQGEDQVVSTLSPTLLIYSLINAIKTLSADIEAIKAALPPGILPLPAVEGD